MTIYDVKHDKKNCCQGRFLGHDLRSFRFIVIDKLGADLDKTFKGGENRLSTATIANIAIQVLS